MDADVKTKWIEALRSGKYQQCRLSLHDTLNDQYCCLGVLCDITNIPHEDKHNRRHYIFEQGGPANSGLIPNGFCNLNRVYISILVDLNDAFKKSFDEIATWIEWNL